MWGQVRELSGGSSWVGGNLIYQDLTASFLSCRWWILVCSHQATSVNAFVSLTKSPFWKSHFPRLNPVNSLVFSSVTIRLSKTFIWVFPYSLTEETMNFLVNSISREFQKKKKVFTLTSMQNSCLICVICLCLLKDILDERICFHHEKKAHWRYSSC